MKKKIISSKLEKAHRKNMEGRWQNLKETLLEKLAKHMENIIRRKLAKRRKDC